MVVSKAVIVVVIVIAVDPDPDADTVSKWSFDILASSFSVPVSPLPRVGKVLHVKQMLCLKCLPTSP